MKIEGHSEDPMTVEKPRFSRQTSLLDIINHRIKENKVIKEYEYEKKTGPMRFTQIFTQTEERNQTHVQRVTEIRERELGGDAKSLRGNTI